MAAKKKEASSKAKTKVKKAAKPTGDVGEAETGESSAQASPAKTTKKETPSFGTKKFADFSITQKRSGRFQVVGLNGKIVNGADKAKVLVDAKLVKTGLTKAAASEAPTPDASPANAEAPTEATQKEEVPT